jgi:hypothetical protein
MKNKTLKRKLLNLVFLLRQFGLDPIRFIRGIKYFPQFCIDYINFNKFNKLPIYLKPCLHDRFEESGSTKSEYFWQDLLVANLIYLNNPQKHVDIGSRIDGFVAHVASFREIEVFDVRNITSMIPNVKFIQADFMKSESLNSFNHGEGYCDSISCLHTIEHFGLGRYGDPIQPLGYELGISNMGSLLKKGGKFYLSTPIGKERVEFNANRVFNPLTIIEVAERNNLKLDKAIIVDDNGEHKEFGLNLLQDYAKEYYNLAIFIFIKISNE